MFTMLSTLSEDLKCYSSYVSSSWKTSLLFVSLFHFIADGNMMMKFPFCTLVISLLLLFFSPLLLLLIMIIKQPSMLSSLSYLSYFASESLSFSPLVLSLASSFSSSSSTLSVRYLPGQMTRASWPIRRPSPSDLWCWVTSSGPAQKAPTKWGISVAMETVSPVHSPQCHNVQCFRNEACVCVSV